MDPDEWTPARGWAIALGKGLLRAAIALIVLTAGLYFAWPIDRFLPLHWAVLGVLFLASATVGYPIGHVVANKLAEDSGLAGTTIMFPVLLLLLAAYIVAYRVASMLRGQSGWIMWFIVVSAAFWSLATAAKMLALE